MPDLIQRLVLKTDCWKQVNWAYFSSPVFAEKIVQGHKGQKINEGRQRLSNKGQNFKTL